MNPINNDLTTALNSLNDTMRQQFQQEQLSRILPTPNTTTEQLKKLVQETQEQNKILLEQVNLLKEENERQKEQIISSKAV